MAARQMPNTSREANSIVPAQRFEDWRKLKALVLDSVSSPITYSPITLHAPNDGIKLRVAV